jgi:hypothetical protein
MLKLQKSIFLFGPYRWRRIGFAVSRGFWWRHPFQRYRACDWTSLEVCGIRIYWWRP